MKLVRGDEGRILLGEGGEFKLVYASTPEAQIPRIVRKRGYAYTAFSKRKAFVVDEDEMSKVYPEVTSRGLKSFLFLPLSYRGKSIGVLVINSFKKERFTSRELDILRLFGSMASLAIRKTHLYNELRRALGVRDLFISMASHELRTPLTTVNGYIQLLHSRLAGADTQESRWIEELSWEAYRLTGLVNELLEANRIKQGQLNYNWSECSLKEVVSRVLLSFKFNHPGHRILFKDRLEGKSDRVIGDFDKLLQVFTNLLDNATKYSAKGSEVILELRAKGPCLVILVKDRGTGINGKDLPRVFEEFHRATKTKGGMGLGLYLTNNIIKQHHGSVEIKSKVNIGTVVVVKLPRAKI